MGYMSDNGGAQNKHNNKPKQ